MVSGAPTTIPGMLLYQAESGPDGIALREKKYGIWRSMSWLEYLSSVRRLALGLHRLGLERGSPLVFMCDNRPEWLFTEIAAMANGSLSFGIYPDNENLDEIAYLVGFSEAEVVVCEDQEQTDKILAIRSLVPRIRHIIVIEHLEVRNYQDPGLIRYEDVLSLGTETDQKEPGLFHSLLGQIDPEHVAILSSTSGTTSRPKLAVLSHRNLVRMAQSWDAVDPTDKDFQYVSFLPTAWIGERMTALARALYRGFTVNFPEKAETTWRDMREIGPHLLFSPPRIWEKMWTSVQVKIQDSNRFKRWCFSTLMPVAAEVAHSRIKKERVSPFLVLLSFLANVLLLRKLRDHLGLSRTRYLYTGGAAIGIDLFRFFLALGVRMKQGYGLTESGAIATMHRSDDIKLESVGRPYPGLDVRISDTGEILIQGDTVFQGYYKNPAATEEVFQEGWLRSGDKGYLDSDGHLILIDRMGEVMRLSDGSEFSPQFIENKLKFSPYVKEAVVIGHNKGFVVALVQIDIETVGKWAEDRNIAYTTFRDLSSKDEVYALIGEEIDRANGDLPKVAQIRRFLMLEKELDPEDEELTQTQKIRRSAIMERYREKIDSLYGR